MTSIDTTTTVVASAPDAGYRPAAADLSLDQLRRAGRGTYVALFLAEHFLGPRRFERLLGPARERCRARMREYFSSWPKNVRKPVRELRFESHAAFLRDQVPASEPVVFRGFAKHWPAVGKWTLDFFGSRFDHTQAVMIDQYGLIGDGEEVRYAVSTLGQIVRAIQAGERTCLRFSRIIDENPELKLDLDMPWLRGFRNGFSVRELTQFFLAPASTFTPIHCALESNVFVQVAGRKRWLLYPAMYQQLLEPPADRRPYFHTDFRSERPSPRFPLGAYAPAFEVILDEGDVMYVPPFVWHCVENLTPTIAVAYRFFSVRAGIRSSWLLTLLKFLATKPSLARTLFYTLIQRPNYIYRPRVD